MAKSIGTRFVTLIGLLAGQSAFAPVAYAQEENTRSASPSPTLPMTDAQLADFASVVEEPIEVVAQRLRLDPGMLPLALYASDARSRRLQRGRAMGIVGLSTFAVGVALGILGLVYWDNYHPSCTVEKDGGGCSDVNPALGVIMIGILATGGGAAVGLVGLHKLNTLSDAEEAALRRYYPPGSARPQVAPPPYFHPDSPFGRSATQAGKALVLPLLSFRF
jgi:hypothetical protein